MPYPGVPRKYWEKLDRCVQKVMASSAFERTYKNRKNKKMTRKSLAIAICRSQMGI